MTIFPLITFCICCFCNQLCDGWQAQFAAGIKVCVFSEVILEVSNVPCLHYVGNELASLRNGQLYFDIQVTFIYWIVVFAHFELHSTADNCCRACWFTGSCTAWLSE